MNDNENGRTGYRAGIFFCVLSQSSPRHIGFSRLNDQIHHVSMTIPRQYYQSDGNLKVLFQVRLTENDPDNESAGFDNIRITARFNCPETTDSAPTTPPQGCVTTQRLSYETFEDQSLHGWANGVITTEPNFSTFLGRYWKGNSGTTKTSTVDPSKTYNIPTTAAVALFEFDFYEIDSWNAEYLCVIISERALRIGPFNQNSNENGITGSGSGLSYFVRSRARPRNIGFSTAKDQIHRITIAIPHNYYALSGSVKITFQVQTNGVTIEDESGGFDNIELTAKNNCPRPTPAPRPTHNPTLRPTPTGCNPFSLVHEETFEDGSLLGWTNGRIESSPNFSRFLGLFWRDTAALIPSKTYDGLPTNADWAIFEFDFYEIDSWDSLHDKLIVTIDSWDIDLGGFDQDFDENGRTGHESGITWFLQSKDSPQDLGFSRFHDQIHHVVMTIPNNIFQDGEMTVSFEVRVNESIVDESGGFDNIRVVAKYDCFRRLGATASSQFDQGDMMESGDEGALNQVLSRTNLRG